jgi:hypothetical protein
LNLIDVVGTKTMSTDVRVGLYLSLSSHGIPGLVYFERPSLCRLMQAALTHLGLLMLSFLVGS